MSQTWALIIPGGLHSRVGMQKWTCLTYAHKKTWFEPLDSEKMICFVRPNNMKTPLNRCVTAIRRERMWNKVHTSWHAYIALHDYPIHLSGACTVCVLAVWTVCVVSYFGSHADHMGHTRTLADSGRLQIFLWTPRYRKHELAFSGSKGLFHVIFSIFDMLLM